MRTGRNYDFKDDTSALLVRNHPRGGYASIGFAALNNLGDNTPLDSVAGRAAALMGPFAQLDGVNECGVSIAVLTLDSQPCDQDTQRPVINTSLAIRLVLDRAATTQEAVDLLSAYDMHAMAGRDYHFFINDAAGDARVVEWDPRDPDRAFKATPVRQVTNFYACYGDEVLPNQKNGELGHGKERAVAIADVLDATVARIEQLFQQPHDGVTGVNTGYDDLNKKTAGLQPSDLIIVAARPSMGKTTFAMNLVENAAMLQDKPVLIYFWGTWCPVCRQTSPSVQKIAQTSDYPVVSIAVSSGSNQDIQQYMQQKGLSFTTVNDQEGELFRNWQGQVTPSYAIIKDGNMVQGFTGIQPAWVLRLRLGLVNFS